MKKSTSTAIWQGTGKEGSGTVSTNSGVLNQAQYSFKTRFEDGIGTNPEELIAAAHAGCFSMKLSFILNAAGYTADAINTQCTVSLDAGVVTNSHLVVTATVPGIDAEAFAASAKEAVETCPISKLLNTQITIDASLA